MATMAELVGRYNAKVPAAKRVKRFESKAIAEKRVAAVQGAKRGRKVTPGKVRFLTAPPDKIWHKESLRANVFHQFEGKTVDVADVVAWATKDAQGMTGDQARGCVNILIKDGLAERVAE